MASRAVPALLLQVKRLDESEANAAMLDGAGPAATLNEHWDGGAGASAAAAGAQAAEKQPAKPPPEHKPPIAARVAVRPRFAVKPKQPAAGSTAMGQSSGAASIAVPAGSAAASAQPSPKRPAEDGAKGAEPAAKRAAVTASEGGSPAASDGAGAGLTGLLGDYGSDDSKSQ
jgi:hypothetical protein